MSLKISSLAYIEPMGAERIYDDTNAHNDVYLVDKVSGRLKGVISPI